MSIRRSKPNVVDQSWKDDIEARLKDGESLRNIANTYGVTYQTLQYWRGVWGCVPLRPCDISGPNHPNWRGGNSIDKDGYRLIYAPERFKSHPYTYEHILVTEKKIGRRLKKNEHVHHINEIKLDNRPENLLACTASDHRRLHRSLEELAIEFYRRGLIVFRDGKYEVS